MESNGVRTDGAESEWRRVNELLAERGQLIESRRAHAQAQIELSIRLNDCLVGVIIFRPPLPSLGMAQQKTPPPCE
jgi:hypothetical protein